MLCCCMAVLVGIGCCAAVLQCWLVLVVVLMYCSAGWYWLLCCCTAALVGIGCCAAVRLCWLVLVVGLLYCCAGGY